MAFANAVDLFLSLHTASLQSIQEAASERRKAEGVGGLSRGHKLPVTLLELMVHCERARAHLHSLSGERTLLPIPHTCCLGSLGT